MPFVCILNIGICHLFAILLFVIVICFLSFGAYLSFDACHL